MTLKLLRIC